MLVPFISFRSPQLLQLLRGTLLHAVKLQKCFVDYETSLDISVKVEWILSPSFIDHDYEPSQTISSEWNVPANQRNVQRWHVYQTWHDMFPLYAFYPPVTAGGGREHGDVTTSNEAAKRTTRVWVTPLVIQKDISICFSGDKMAFFCWDHFHPWVWWPKQMF